MRLPRSPFLVLSDVAAEEDATAVTDVSHIAVFTSDAFAGPWTKVACSSNYIAYNLHGGKVRLLNLHTGARSLLLHSASLTDIRFSLHDPSVLACASSDGLVLVRQLTESTSKVIDETVLARLDLAVTQEEPVQIRWHPGSSRLIVFAARIVMTAITTQEAEVNVPPPTTFTLDNVVTDAAITEDGTLLALACEDGRVLIYDALHPLALGHVGNFWPTAQHHPVSSVLWAGALGDGMRALICGSQDDRFVSLGYWSSTTCVFTSRQVLDVFPLSVGGRKLRYDVLSSTLILSDAVKPSLLAFEVSRQAQFASMCTLGLPHPTLAFDILNNEAGHVLLHCVHAGGVQCIALPAAVARSSAHIAPLRHDEDALAARISSMVTASIDRTLTQRCTDGGLDERLLEAVASRSEASLQRQLQSLQQRLERSMANNIRNVESAMFHKFDEAVAKHMASVLADALAAGLERDVVPSFERACRDMFKQVHTALQSGISQSLSESQQELVASLGKAKPKMTHADAPSIIAPKAVAIEASGNPFLAELGMLIGQRRYEEAFTTALSKGDVELLSWLCSHSDEHDVFGARPALGQAVLLSLVQQLGSDIGLETALKATWIREAALSLDPAGQVFAAHARPILADALHAMQREFVICSERVGVAALRLGIHVLRSLLV